MVESHSSSAARDSRQAILNAARAEFDVAGFGGARVQRIADAAGVNKQLIFYYHESKSGLYRDVVRQSLRELEATTSDHGGPLATKRLRYQVTALYAALAARPHLSRLLFGGSTEDRLTHRIVSDTFSAIITRLAAIITDGQRLGYFRDDCDAVVTARHAVGLILGHLMIADVGKGDPSDPSSVDAAESICRVLLRSLEW